MTIDQHGAFVHTAEHEELRSSLRSFFSVCASEDEVRRLMVTDDGFDPATWGRLSAELGVTGLAIPEQYGGSGYGFVEVGVVLEEAGRSLLPAPYFSTVVLATTLLLSLDDPDAQEEFLPKIADGSLRATVAFPRRGTVIHGERTTGSWRLSGEAAFVMDGHTAELLLVIAETPTGPRIFAIDEGVRGLDRTLQSTMDLTRKLAALQFHGVPARLLGDQETAAPNIEHTRLVAAAGLAAEQVGGAQRVLEMGVEYSKERYQFGRAIGSFQAIKHRLADMLVQVESARSAAYAALWSAAQESPDFAVAAALAKAFCSDAYVFCAGENIQVHGGIGFTWEHPAHLYFKRAKSSALMFGDPADHRQLIARQLGI
ncbi:MAG: acyl-CoA dehydrogenase protein [Mycobacterium sp.]|nr:acyl-CoA dehydrogenase protein [Mycobacterium sp.]